MSESHVDGRTQLCALVYSARDHMNGHIKMYFTPFEWNTSCHPCHEGFASVSLDMNVSFIGWLEAIFCCQKMVDITRGHPYHCQVDQNRISAFYCMALQNHVDVKVSPVTSGQKVCQVTPKIIQAVQSTGAAASLVMQLSHCQQQQQSFLERQSRDRAF